MRSRSAVIAACSVLCSMLAACGGASDTTRPETSVASSITVQPTTGTLDAIGATVQLSASVLDQHGQSMTNESITWQSANNAVATVSTGGLVTAVANGTSQITATAGSAQAHLAITVAQAARALAVVSGDQQSAAGGQALSAPLIVQVNDRLSHGVAGVQVSFHAAAGSGAVSPTSATTNAAGQAQTTWTPSSTVGTQHVYAVATSLDSIAFSATVQGTGGGAGNLHVTPDTLIDGQTATITGATFSTTPTNNMVTIDGVSATVTSATATSLTVQVPAFGCQPSRTVTVAVQVNSQAAGTAQAPLRPATFTTLAIGQEAILQDPTQFCFQFASTASGTETYVMGLSAPAEVPGAVLPFQLSAQSGASLNALMSPSFVANTPFASNARVSGRAVTPRPGSALQSSLEQWRGQARAEAHMRQWDATHLPALAARRSRYAPIAASVRTLSAQVATPAIGDTLTLRVPSFSATDPCTTYTTIRAVVRLIGSTGIWVQDINNPTTDSLTLADIQAASNEFDTQIYATDVAYFGQPTDIDSNGRVIVVLTREVNRTANLLGFVFGGDLFPGDPTCPAANGGEIYYGQVPDPLNTVGTGARTKSDVVAQLPSLIAHEFTHIIQFSQRLILHSGSPMAGWEMEGQATLAEELVGDDVLGNTSGQNYDHTVVFGPAGYDWYSDEFIKLIAYFGGLGTNGTTPNAPDLCTVYGNVQMTTLPCDPAAFYGASWILQRYIGDQYGPTYPGGLAQLTRDWVSKNVTLSGTANIAALLGVNYDTLFARFATALALDDQANSSGTSWVPLQFSITSWNSNDISTYVASCCGAGWLTPPAIGFATTSLSRSVRGGSTAYTVISANGAHPATAIQVTNSSGGALDTALRPTLWIARIQ